MRWGNQALLKDDILFSPCQDRKYYFMKHHGNSTYKLEDGTAIRTTPIFRDTKKYEHLKHINLHWAKHTGGNVTLSTIAVCSCSLNGFSDKLILTCHDYLRGGETIRGIYGENNYEYK
ncbi:hypothetical protein OVS_03230 [Mycoplasma ovis str. Michigan]|uniref:Uncharacterized protein n=1 Tax=Mycoplasma ovis str. Michigan TaxID=1415773 RepID=A0ABM5P1T0_9MOLU|nr:hypothetical protein [Mycoplasma ovis]AHC40399.1 hypothetical protein OVS_03230 [Mycoplasma ovis str. Michigan]